VAARPISKLYLLKKFVRRNRKSVIAAALMLVALTAGIIGTSIGMISESRRRAIAERERSKAQFTLAVTLQSRERFGDAEKLFRNSLQFRGGTAEDSQRAAHALLRLGETLAEQGRLSEADQTFEKALEAYRAAFAPGDSNLALALSQIGRFHRDWGSSYADAEPYFHEALEVTRKTTPPDHLNHAKSAFEDGDALTNLQRFRDAEPILRESITEDRFLVPGQGNLGYATWELGLTLVAQGKMADAERALLEARELLGLEKNAWAESATLEVLYAIWDQMEPGKGYDLKANEWRSRLIQDSLHFRIALAAATNRAHAPTTAQTIRH
jgi:tetratricopeptide (TPR) repeat protein